MTYLSESNSHAAAERAVTYLQDMGRREGRAGRVIGVSKPPVVSYD